MGKKISKEEESNQKSMKKKKSALRKALKFVAGTGVCVGAGALLLSALLLLVLQNTYFTVSGITGEILDRALEYYRLVPINAFLTIVVFYLEQMVYSDGDELCNNICYGFQIGGNVVASIILARFMGMKGIILGSVIGNSLHYC